MGTYYEGCCCFTYDLQHSPSWLLLLWLIVDQLVYCAVLLLCHIYHPAHAFYEVLKKMKNASFEYEWLNGWNSALQAAWYIGHLRWACLFYNNTSSMIIEPRHAHSYDTVVYRVPVHNSNNNVVIFWTMTSIHVVPDRQQYIGLRQAHMLYQIDNSIIRRHTKFISQT